MAKSLVVRIIGDPTELSAALRTATAETETFGNKMGSALKAGGLVAAAGIGVAAIVIDKTVKAAMGFQDAMSQIETQAGASAGEVKKMSAALLTLAPAVGQTPEQLAAGLYHVESAGLRGATALKVLATAAKGAAVGHADLESVTNALVAAQKSGISGVQNMNQAMGTLNSIVGVGNMRMGDLASAMSTGVLSRARNFGLSLKDVGAALATLTDAGVPAVAASTRLGMAFNLLAVHTPHAEKALESIGIKQFDLASKMRSGGLVPALELLKTKLQESGKTANEQAVILSQAFGGGRTSGTIITLLQQLDNVKSKMEALKTGAGGFGAAWETEQKTAAFATADFQASLSTLEVHLGQRLLPAFTSVLNWVNAHWPQISAVADAVFTAVGAAITFLKPYIDKLIGWTNDLVNYVRDHWAQISAYVERAMVTIRSIITQVVSAAQAIWAQFGAAITSIANTSFAAVISVIRNSFQVVVGIFQLIGDLIHGRWGKVWDDIKKIVSNATSAIVTIVETMVSNAYTAALAVGSALVHGILDGIGSIAGSIKDKLTGAVSGALSGVKSVFGIGSPSKVTAAQIGVPLAQGVIEGFLLGITALPSKISTSISTALNAARTVVQASQAVLSTAFQDLANKALQAFDGATQTQLNLMQTSFNERILRLVTDPMNAALAKLSSAGAALTPAEAKLQHLQDTHAAAQRSQALTSARTTLAGDQASGTATPAQLAADQQAINDALYNIQVAALTKTAALQRAHQNAETAAQKAHVTTAYNTLSAALTKTETRQVLDYTSERTLLHDHLQAMLTALGTALDKQPGLWQTEHDKIMKMFDKSFGPDYVTAGENLGTGFAKGIDQSNAAVKAAALRLAETVSRFLPHSPAKEGPLSVLPKWNALLPKFDSAAVRAPVAAMAAGIAGGVGGGGGPVIHVVSAQELFGLLQKQAVLNIRSGGPGLPGVPA